MNETYNTADDLDLIVLFEKLISFLKRFSKILIIFTLIGIAAGFLRYWTSPRKYTATMVLHSFNLTNLENIEIISNWKELLKKNEYATLAGIFNCDPAIVKKISKISAEEIQKMYVQNNPHGFVVTVMVSDTSILSPLQEGIVYGLENGDYIKERTATKRSNLNQLIEKVKSEIIKLDSTKSAVENILSNKNKNSSSLMVDITSINSELISLNEKLLSYKEELKFSDPVQILQKFNKYSYPESRQGPLLLIVGCIAGFIIGYIISMIIYVRQKLIERGKVK